MGYTDVFGGQLLFPSQLSYLQITTAVDITLQWPREQQIEGIDVVADFLDINTTDVALNVTFPDARNASTGNKSTVNNIGGNDFTVRDSTGGVIQFVSSGEQWVLVLTDNSTEAGIWSAFQLGAATTLASASALSGAGLQADGFGMLEQIIDSDVEAGTPFTAVDGDRAKCLIYTAGAGTCNLPSPGAVGNNWFFLLRNSGSGTLNIVPPSGNIDGSSSLNLDPNGSTFIFTDGADFFTIGLTVASTIAFDFVSLAVPGSGDFVLSGANLNRISYRFTGALTGNRRIVVPNTTQQYWCDNQTSGSFTLEISTAAGSGQIVPQGNSVIVYCDATDVINATSSTSVSFPITIGQGGTNATTVGGAQINLQVPPEGRLLTAGDGIVGGGDLTADRTFDFDLTSIMSAAPAVGDFLAFEDIDNANVNRKATITDILALASGVTITGTPVDNEIAVWDSATSLEGDSNFRWTGSAFQIEGTGVFEIRVGTVTTFDLNAMTELNIRGMDENDDGLVLEDGMKLTFEDQTFANPITMQNEGPGNIGISVRGGGLSDLIIVQPVSLQFNTSGLITPVNVSILTTTVRRLNIDQPLRVQGSIYMMERSSAPADFAGDAQIWIDNSVQNRLMFTDEIGVDMAVVTTQFVVKSGSQSVFNSTVFVDDNDMTGIQMDQSQTYRIRMHLFVSQSSAVPDFKVRIIGEGAGTFTFIRAGGYAAGSSEAITGDAQAGTQLEYSTISGDNWIIFDAIGIVGNADTFKVQFAQRTANATNTTVEAPSYIEVTKIDVV